MSPPRAGGQHTSLDLAQMPTRAATGTLLHAMTTAGLALTAAIGYVGGAAVGSNADLVVLATLRLDGPQRPGVLTKLTGITSGGITNLLDRLERSRLVHRTTDGVQDGRGVLVELTADGTRAIEAIGGVVGARFASAPEPFDEMRRQFAATGREVPGLPSSVTDVAAQLDHVLRLAELGRVVSDILGSAIHDPSPTKSTLTLWFGSRSGGVRPGRLAALTGLSSAGVSELLDRLEQRRLVERTAGRPPDRRAVTVETTGAGHELLDSALDAIGRHLDRLQALLSRR